MKHYFLVAKEVGDLTAIVCAALEEKQAKPRAIFERFLRRFGAGAAAPRKATSSSITTASAFVDARCVQARSRQHHPAVLDRPIITACRCIPTLCARVTLSLRLIDANLRANEEANRLFLEILLSRQHDRDDAAADE